jgi:phage baseplate assembly protein W
MNLLNDPPYLAFPLRIGAQGAAVADRRTHVRQQIEQVLLTNPGERIFRPDFGAGLKQLVFEPNASVLWEITRKRIASSLAEALRGEVDPKSLEVDVRGEGEKLLITVSYALAAIGHAERHEIRV